MRVAVIIPDRSDRPEFTKNCLRMIMAQTLQPVKTILIDTPSRDNSYDITKRYRIGYNTISEFRKDIDVIAFMENDDYYHPTYLEKMCDIWNDNGRPDLLGLNHTMYYHIFLKKYFIMKHNVRSSAMNTLIRPDLNIKWCPDDQPYTDLHLWMGDSNITGKKIIVPAPKDEICIGIKHGIGKPGGYYHSDHLDKFTIDDHDFRVLKYITDPESFAFYKMMNDKFNLNKFTFPA